MASPIPQYVVSCPRVQIRNLLDVCVLRGDGRCPAHRSIWRKFRGFEMYGESFPFKMYTDFDGDGKPISWDVGPESVEELESGGLIEAII